MRTTEVIVVSLVAVCVLAGPAGAEEKSLTKAMLFSTLLPGTGELYMGYESRAKVALGAEAAIWAGYGFFRYQGSLREDTYKEMAVVNAGVSGQRGDDYYEAIAYYLNNEDYNVDILREARFYYPYDRELQLEYWNENGYFDSDAWEWKSAQAMDDFRNARTESRKSYHRATLMLGFAVLNRMVSVVGLYVAHEAGEGHAALLPDVQYRPGNGGGAYLSFGLPMVK